MTVVMTLSLVAFAATPRFLGAHLDQAFVGAGRARPIWVWLAGVGFICSLVGMAGAWRVALVACGARLNRRDACARYGVGSLVNTVAPYRLGDVVRVGLFSDVLHGSDRVWRTSGALAVVEAARMCCIAALVGVAFGLGALPLWPAVALGVLSAAAALVAIVSPRASRLHRKVAHLLEAFRELTRVPARAGNLVGLVALATAARVLAAASVCSALHLRSPIVTGLLIVAALDLAGQLPLTPGNFGITSGTVAVAWASHGVGLTAALATGIVLHAVETAAGVTFGAAGALRLAGRRYATARRMTPILAGALASVAVVGFSLSVFGHLA